MDFDLEVEYSPEQEEFREEVRQWLDENVPKDLYSPRDPIKATYEQWLQRRELGRQLGKKGWLYPTFPKEYGGGSLSGELAFVLREELGARRIGQVPYHDAGGGLGAPVILALGGEEQKKRLLPPILTGEAATWELFTEPEAGTDEANQQTNALRVVREGEYFIISGQKIFVGGLYAPPEQFLLLTRSDLQAPRHENLAMFICPANLPGITIAPLDLFVPGMFSAISGQTVDASEAIKHQVFFDDVKLHESYLIGGDHDGWKIASATLDIEHGGAREGGARGGERRVRGRTMSMPRNLISDNFLQECKSNPNIIKRLKENPQLVGSVVNVYIDWEKQRLFSLRNAGGRGGAYGGPQAQMYTKNAAARLIIEMGKVLGPYALTSDEEWGLAEGMLEVGQRGGVCFAPAGTPEAAKIIISRALAIGR